MPFGQTLANLLPLAGSAIGGFAAGPAAAPLGATVGGGLGTIGRDLLNDYFQQQSPSSNARNQLLQQLQGPVPYQRVDFNPIAQEETRRYQQEVVPNIANQFAGLGGLSSSGFQQSLTGAGQDLQTRLAALRAQHEVGQQNTMGGAEERRRQMLSNLSGGIYGEEQGQQLGRQNIQNQLMGAIPGQLMDLSRFQLESGQNDVGTILKNLTNQQNAQNTAINQAGQLNAQALGQSLENLIRQDPTKWEQILRPILDVLNGIAQVSGTAVGAALKV